MEHRDIEKVAEAAHSAMNRLTKWRAVFAGWQLGTRPDTDGETRAVRDHREVTMLLRAEVNALAGLLNDKGVFTALEWTERVGEEAEALSKSYAERFDGFEATDEGMRMDVHRAAATMRALGFPR